MPIHRVRRLLGHGLWLGRVIVPSGPAEQDIVQMERPNAAMIIDDRNCGPLNSVSVIERFFNPAAH